MNNKIPIILVTGFLGSGKTSFISNFLSLYSKSKKIAIIQNEFAQSSIDGEILKEENNSFILREINRGSIFCACQFSNFKDTLFELSKDERADIVVVEATGIADPIAIAQVMEDERLSSFYYIQNIVTIIDGSRFINILENIVSVKHQIEIADTILVNKSDLIDENSRNIISDKIAISNPFAHLSFCSHGQFSPKEIMKPTSEQLVSANIKGELTKCGQGNYISRVFKTSQPISIISLEKLLSTLDNDILRLKGYVTNNKGESVLVQYVPGQTEVISCKYNVGKTELISIGYKEPNFRLLQCQ